MNEPMTARDDLLERLLATRQTNPQNLPGGFPNVEQPINPDGPAAVQEIERLEAGVARIANRMIKPGASRSEIQAMCAALLKSQEQPK